MVNVEKLLLKLDSDNNSEVIDTLKEMEKLRLQVPIEIMNKVAKSSDDRVRTQLAITLGEIGNIDAAEIILRLAKDKDTAVRMEATHSLGIMGAQGFSKAKNALEFMLSDENFFVRKYAINALGECGDPTTIDKLVEIFKKDETSIEIKEIIARSIGNIGGAYAITILKGWIEEGSMEIRREAIMALGCMGTSAAIDLLISIVRDKKEDKIIKNHAKYALKNIVNVMKEKYLTIKKRVEEVI